jgi:aspartate/methionine/tyrosine aminotransferase
LSYGVPYKKLAAVIGDVPAIAMRGISKEFPWPGGRCGWIEFYNREKDEDFNIYCKSLIDAKMLEVCSTTLPQMLIPQVMRDERYYPMLKERSALYQSRAQHAYDVLSTIPEVIIHKPNGAFYMTLVFKEGVLNNTQTLPFANAEVGETISRYLSGAITNDKRFVYYLLASKGICVVPLTSGFNSTFDGFRFTVLEQNEDVFKQTIATLKESITAYIAS